MLKYLRHISRKPVRKAKKKIVIYNLHNGWHDKHAEGKINQRASVAPTVKKLGCVSKGVLQI
jgi:hypothetical protein